MSKIKILIIEDETDLGEDLQYQLEEIGYEVTGIAPDLKEAYGLLMTQKPDIAIVDIMLNGQPKGIEFAQSIHENQSLRRPVIFLTGMSDKETFENAKKTIPAGYLLKPFNIKELQFAIELATGQFHNAGESLPDCLFMKKGNHLVKINYKDILYATVEGKYSEVHTSDNKYIAQCSLKKIEHKFPASFMRVHNNYLVNLTHVEKFNQQDNQLLLTGRRYVPVSRQCKPLLLKKLDTLK